MIKRVCFGLNENVVEESVGRNVRWRRDGGKRGFPKARRSPQGQKSH